MMMVLFLVSSSIAFCRRSSFSGSTLAVASSRITMGASFNIALAMLILCFSPPERDAPPSPITVLYPSGSASMNSAQQAFLAASTTWAWVASGLPNLILFSMVSAKR